MELNNFNNGKDIAKESELDKAETFLLHLEQLKKCNEPIKHNVLLKELLRRIKKVDFRELAELEDDEKLNNSHFQIITIEQVLDLASNNRWGICKNHDFLYLYNGSYWSLLEVEELKTFLGEAAERLGVYKFKARYFNFREQLYKQFIAVANLPKPEQLQDLVLINLRNGTFQITPNGNNLRPFDRVDFLNYQLPFEYNPGATAPLFQAFLDRVLPDKDRQKILAEYLGYVFIRNGTIKEEKVLFLYGTGANGKSVFHEIVKAMLGNENISQFSLQDLTNENGYYRAMIANKLVNYASEINGKLQSATFKQLASCETVSARLPYGNPMQISDYARLIFNVNELPKEVEQTNAFFRRFLIIPFDITIPEAEQDKQLHTKIIERELSGVFNWVLQGLNNLLKQKRFSFCEASQKARERYKTESDSVKMFLEDEEYIVSLSDYLPLKELYNGYKNYCQDNGYFKCTQRTFSERLRTVGFQMERRNYGMSIYAQKKVVC